MAFILIWSLAVFYAGRNWAIKRDISGYTERVDTLVVRDTIVQEKPVYRTIFAGKNGVCSCVRHHTHTGHTLCPCADRNEGL